jgi:hypothetical protein
MMAFIDRVVEHPGRYTLTNSETGEVLGTFRPLPVQKAPSQQKERS